MNTVIGLEIHVELSTKTNSHTCPVCTGMPGSLPVLNQEVVRYAAAVGLATHCQIDRTIRFDRKNYFYPDNPQDYQLTQFYPPIWTDGFLDIKAGGGTKRIRIREIHMEEDAGKLIHDPKKKVSYLDFNRSGVPLIEIVTQPDFASSEEVLAFLAILRLRIRYLDVSDCRLNEGSMRVDVNLSVKPEGEAENGTRTEMKNLNSFRQITAAIRNEKERQEALLLSGKAVEQETRRWDEDKNESFSMRSKEDLKDYRYFPEPDLLPFTLPAEWIEEIRKELPEFREEKIRRYIEEYHLPEYDAKILTEEKAMADFFERAAALSGSPKQVSNWLMGETMRLQKEQGLLQEQIPYSAEHLADLIRLVESGQINSTVAKEVFLAMFCEDQDPKSYVQEHGLLTVTYANALAEAVNLVLEANPKSVSDYRNGKDRALGFLVGLVMKEMKGKADPKEVNRLLKEQIIQEGE